jgi:hypothetical protein
LHALAVGASFADGWMQGTSALRPYHNDVVVQVGAAYRVSPRLALGGVGSFSPGAENDHQTWRLSVEGRVFAITTRFVEVWGAGEAGFAASRYVPNDFGVGDCIAPGGCATPSYQKRAHLAPLMGAGAGIDLLPLRYVSVGIEGRALMPYFFARAVDGGPQGFSPIFTLGMTLTGRVPLG